MPDFALSAQNLQEFLELQAELFDNLLTLADIFPGFRSGQGRYQLEASRLKPAALPSHLRPRTQASVRLMSIDKKVSPKVTLAPYTLHRSALVKLKRVKELR